MTKNGEKLYFLALTLLGLFMLYLGWQSAMMNRYPPPNPNPQIDELYKGK